MSLASQTQLAMHCVHLDSLNAIERPVVPSIKQNSMDVVCKLLASTTKQFFHLREVPIP
jgi:hypothetical protein